MPANGLRVLHVVEATTSGTKRHVLDLVAGLKAYGIINHVACPPVRQTAYGDTDFVPRLHELGVVVHPIPLRSVPHPWFDARATLALYRLLQREQFDIVHTHSAKGGFLGRLAARMVGSSAVVYTPHAFGFQQAPRLARGFYELLERMAARWSDAIICVSPSEYHAALRQGFAPAARLALIRNGIDVHPFDIPVDVHAVRAALGVGSAPLAVSVGRLMAQKGLDILLAACPDLIAACPSARVLIVGDGPLRKKLEAQAVALGVQEHVKFTGYRTDIPAILAAADVFVLASRYEGLPYTVLEAMAARKPVVATNVTGSRDAVVPGETGFLVPPEDPPALARAVLRLLADPQTARRMGEAGRRHVEQHFTVTQMVAETCNLYERLLMRARAA